MQLFRLLFPRVVLNAVQKNKKGSDLIFIQRFLILFLVSLSVLGASRSQAASPADLAKWESWIMEQHPEQVCPFSYKLDTERTCAWSTRLGLNVAERELKFSQQWNFFQEGWLILPGEKQYWPLDVTLDGAPVAVVSKQVGKRLHPAIWVEPGFHKVEGRINWQRRPQSISIPQATALIQVVIDGREVATPHIDSKQRLWLTENLVESAPTVLKKNEESVGIQVFRLFQDAIPFLMEVELVLEVAGNPRELQLGQILFDQFKVTHIQSALPARIEADGTLLLQARPGNYRISVSARYAGDTYKSPETLTFKPQSLLWPDEEVWAFKNYPELRRMTVENVRSIDPQQTNLPDAWRRWSAYRVLEGQVIKLTEQRRGDPEPAPNQLQLSREMWLDFDGLGMTIRDQIDGSMNKEWRLGMVAPYELGLIEKAGQPQVITEIEGENGQVTRGVEVREKQLGVQAVSRLDFSADEFPATGWNNDFQGVQMSLNLPPGWKLFGVVGADSAPSAWISRWTLWDIFLVVVVVAATFRLLNFGWGLISALTFVLIHQESSGVLFAWVNLLIVIALLQVLSGQKSFTQKRPLPLQMLLFYGRGSAVLLLLIVIPLMVELMRHGVYPQLERPHQQLYYQDQSLARVPAVMEMEESLADSSYASGLAQTVKPARSRLTKSMMQPLTVSDPNASAQTGPGVPSWQWRKDRIYWDGPVAEAQNLQIILLNPWINRGINFISVVFLALFLLGAGKRFLKLLQQFPKPSADASSAASLLSPLFVITLFTVILSLQSPMAVAQEYPSTELLDRLERRLLEPKQCLPNCASIARMWAAINDQELNLRLQVDAVEQVDIPLVKVINGWRPQHILINGEPAQALYKNPKTGLHIAVPPGKNDILVKGQLDKVKQVNLSFVMEPHNVTVETEGWRASGVMRGHLMGRSLVFEKIEQEDKPKETSRVIAPDPIEPLVVIERTIVLGINWYVQTKVRRLAPRNGVINLQIPVLPGESVTSEKIEVENDKVQLVLSANQQQANWASSLRKTGQLKLLADKNHTWVEVWKVDVSPIWHLKSEGVPPTKDLSNGGTWKPIWNPWPGETLSLQLTRPKAYEGNTFTVQSVNLDHRPGQRMMESSMHLEINSSRGEEKTFILPKDAQVIGVDVDGESQPFSDTSRYVTVPVNPGQHSILVKWRLPVEFNSQLNIPGVELGVPSANVTTNVTVPKSRWVIWVNGPAVGPAITFWSIVGLVLLAAILLGRIERLPLSSTEWMLLGVGLSTVAVEVSLLIVAWFFVMQKRSTLSPMMGKRLFNLMQLGLAFLSVAVFASFISSIPMGLLGHPDMGIQGNGSSRFLLRWYQDLVGDTLPEVSIISLPIWGYRVVMLLWSLWLAYALMRWMRWGWNCFSNGGLWAKEVGQASPESVAHGAGRGENSNDDASISSRDKPEGDAQP